MELESYIVTAVRYAYIHKSN